MNTVSEVLVLVFGMGAVIFFCRAFPFLFFGGGKEKVQESGESPRTAEGEKSASRGRALFGFVEKTVPPAAMTVLAFNALGGAFRDNFQDGFLALAASVVTALLHLWKRNSLISIFGGTALYMLLARIA